MLENRSFDHLLGALKAQNPAVAGALDNEFSNQTDPAVPTSPPVATGPALKYAMPFDPGHEFEDVQIQLYGRVPSADRRPAPPTDAAPMDGFVYSAEQAAKLPTDAGMVMQCFHPERLPTLTALAAEFALFNYWHSSLPGPTWRNRFFVHAATSGGLSDSPTDRVQLTLAHACDLQTLDPPSQIAARHRYLGIRAQQDAADYVEEMEDRIRDRRRSSESAP